ncbi:MMPL family transporter [Streptomyces sp. RPA4-5]|uniref:MMPL family transporter n=1 Tax=Streptomyces TaxID=1883 RepID=UPI00143E22B3|nr:MULTISPECIES: MMPL family transporter [Streptomyces]MCX4639843.1 MMPL family transporter [Streptomyces platensis]QIY56688.1 MMPL family transporter [Streptomyces sp. RPA4-5]WJY39598.1 MMPL family transporter [Streptomyces sp. P9-2B-2]
MRLAVWSARHPWRALAGWLAFVVLCLGVGLAMGTHNATGEDYRVGEAGRAETLAAEARLDREPVEQVLISARSGPLEQTAADAAVRDLTARMRTLPEVARVEPPVRSADGASLRVAVVMKGVEADAKDHVAPLAARTAAVQRSHPELRVAETGSPSVSVGVNTQRGQDLALSEAIALPVTLLTLLVVFGSALMAAVPLLLALTSIAAAMGLSMVVSHLQPDAGVGANIILLIGMAVGVDYTLFYLKREREERARAGGRLGAEALVELAAATSGRAIVVSGLAVIVSTATLYLATDVVFSSLATSTVIVVLAAVLSSLTALPALLVKIAQRAERRADRRAQRTGRRPAPRERAEGTGRLWRALLRPATEHPARTLCVSVLLMLALAAPALGMQLRVLNKDSHSREIPALQTYDRLTTAFPELRVQHQIVVRAPAAESSEVTAALRQLSARAQSDPLYAKGVTPLVKTSRDHRTTTMELSTPHKVSSPEAIASLDRLRRDYLPDTVGAVPGAEFAVSGDVAHDTDYLAHQDGKLPLVIGALLLLTFLMTTLVFRSVVIGLLGVALNLLSAAAAFGLVVVFFQHGLASTLFGFDTAATSAIGSRVPLFLFVILFGLSMDYQIFVVSRIREAALGGVPTREAVLHGVGASAKVVTSAAAVMVTVFAAFMFLHLAEMKQIGFSLAVAVLLDAFVIRVVILPSALTLLGRASWWPSRTMRRAQEAVAVRGVS